MAMSCTLTHQSATWFTISEDLGSFAERVELAPASASIWHSFTRKAAREALKKMKIKICNGKIVKN